VYGTSGTEAWSQSKSYASFDSTSALEPNSLEHEVDDATKGVALATASEGVHPDPRPRSSLSIASASAEAESKVTLSAVLKWIREVVAAMTSRDGLIILSLVVSIVFVSAFDWVLWKRTLNKFHSKSSNETYSFFVLQLYIVLEFFLALGACLYRIATNQITREMRDLLPFKVLGGISSLDTVSMLLSSMAAPVVAGHVQTLLNQLTLPLLMVFSLIFLAVRYNKYQYLGALLIVGGAVMAAVPNVNSTNKDGRENKAWGLIVYALSLIPFALSNVYREYVFRDKPRVDIFYLMVWTLAIQFVLGWGCVPILAIPAFGGVPLSEVPDQVTLGYKCLMGDEVQGLECHVGTKPLWFLLGYVLLNFVVSILRLLLIKRASAVLLQVTNAMALLTSNLIFCSEVFMGKDKEDFNIYDAFGLVIVVSGFVVFRVAQYYLDKEEGDRLLPAEELTSDGTRALAAETSTSEQDSSESSTPPRLARYSISSNRSRKWSRVRLEDESLSLSMTTGMSRHGGGQSRLLNDETEDSDCALRTAAIMAAFSASHGQAQQIQPNPDLSEHQTSSSSRLPGGTDYF